MNSFIGYIYRRSPVWLQNAGISTRGYFYNRKRYGGQYKICVDQLMRSQWWDEERFLDYQQKRLQRLLVLAASETIYYRNTLPNERFLRQFELRDLGSLPILFKSVLRERLGDFTVNSRLKYGYEEGHTSGTSGTPMVWKYDYRSMQENLAFRERQYRWGGVTGNEVSARFSGRLLARDGERVFWRYNSPEKQFLFSSYHLTETNSARYLDTLVRNNVQFIDGYPSAIYALAKYLSKIGEAGKWRPWAIFTTAETLAATQRSEIERVFGAKVFNFYSSSEGAPFITECAMGNYHINPESGIVEVLRDDGSSAARGEVGNLVVTSFFQKSVPLIRYKIGDRAALSVMERCSCGRQMPMIEAIDGRENDVVFTTEKGFVGSAGLSTAFYKVPNRIVASQLEQVEIDAFVFRYVADVEMKSDELQIVEQELKDRLGARVKIVITRVNEIAKGKNGKTRLIIGKGVGS